MKTPPKIEGLLNKFQLDPTGGLYDALVFEILSLATKELLSRISSWDKDRIVHYGLDTFGTREKFYDWLWQTLPQENAKPIDLIRDGAIKKVLGIIGRIKAGIYS